MIQKSHFEIFFMEIETEKVFFNIEISINMCKNKRVE